MATKTKNWLLQHNKIFYLVFSLFCAVAKFMCHKVVARRVREGRRRAVAGGGGVAACQTVRRVQRLDCLHKLQLARPPSGFRHRRSLGNFVFALAKHCKNLSHRTGHICDSNDQRSAINDRTLRLLFGH